MFSHVMLGTDDFARAGAFYDAVLAPLGPMRREAKSDGRPDALWWLGAGGTDEGAPGERPQYGAGCYGAYLRDPDGNKVHVVHRGDVPDGLDAGGDRG